MKQMKKTIGIMIMLYIMIISATTAIAASGKAKALKAYSVFLSSNESKFLKTVPAYGYFSQINKEKEQTAESFLIVDLDKNGIPELVTYHILGYKNTLINVYAYKKEKVKRIKRIHTPTYTAPTSWWGLTAYACSQKHLHLFLMNGVGRDDYVYYIKDGKVSRYAEHDDHWYINENIYKIKGKKTTSARYNNAVKRCVQKASLVTNNSVNRKNRLK